MLPPMSQVRTGWNSTVHDSLREVPAASIYRRQISLFEVDKAVDRMRASVREFGFVIPVLARSTGEVIDGHLRLKAAIAENMAQVPVIACDDWTEADFIIRGIAVPAEVIR
jgi:ParB-like chromosome segregation protein Spo0J